MKDGKLCRVRGDRSGKGKAEPILIGTWKDPSNCSRPIGWQSVVGFLIGIFFFFEITGGTRKGKWQAKRTVICHALTWDTFSRSVKICPFRHTNSWAIWDEDLSKMENPPPWLFKHSRAGAHQGEGGGSGLPDVQTTRGCTVCREFKESKNCLKVPFIITMNRQF